jgi:hypothetical protein
MEVELDEYSDAGRSSTHYKLLEDGYSHKGRLSNAQPASTYFLPTSLCPEKGSARYESSQGLVYAVGLLTFAASFVFIGLAHAVHADQSLLNWSYFTAAVLQTAGGTISVITADLSVNRYFSRHRYFAQIYAVLWVVAMGVECAGAPRLESAHYAVQWMMATVYVALPAMPFVYLLLQPAVLEMRRGEPTFCDLLTASLSLWLTANGIWYLLSSVLKRPTWPYYMTGIVNFLGAIAVLVAHFYAPFKWKGDPSAIRSVSALWVFIVTLGIEELCRQIVDTLVYDEEEGAVLTFRWSVAGFCFSPIHMVGAPLMLYFRPALHGWLGQFISHTEWQARKLSIGGGLVIAGFLLYAFAYFGAKGDITKPEFALCFMIEGALQTAGLLTITSSNIDQDLFVHLYPSRAFTFVILWLVYIFVFAFTPPFPLVNQVIWVSEIHREFTTQ